MLWMRGCKSERFNAGLAVWLVALGAIIPSLDRELLGSQTVIASGHHEACAHTHHDHTLCIQFGKQGWSTDSSIPLQVFPPRPDEDRLDHSRYPRRIPPHRPYEISSATPHLLRTPSAYH